MSTEGSEQLHDSVDWQYILKRNEHLYAAMVKKFREWKWNLIFFCKK